MPNVCKYWITDEPSICKYWNASDTICTFEGTDANGNPYKAPLYPYCNLLGTSTLCNQYSGSGTQKRCVLPDPFRHVCNRETGEKWVTVTGTMVTEDENGAKTRSNVWSWDQITEYNNGNCDGAGTASRCSGYNPYDMAFGKLKPEPLPTDLLSELQKPWTGYKTTKELGYRLPFSYEVWNRRAMLSRCAWWNGDIGEFSINEDMGYVNPITSRCTKPDSYVNQFKEDSFALSGNYSAPCNGCKPECAYYTGLCWEYCIDDKMQEGDKVLAEQLLELRYYLKNNRWTYEDYVKSFKDAHIYAWLGPDGLLLKYKEDGNVDIDNSIITAIHLYQNEFDSLNIIKEEVPLTTGTASQNNKTNYPTLIKELKNLYVTPTIRNQFDKFEDKNIIESNKLGIDETVLIFGDSYWYDYPTYGINLNDPDIKSILPTELLQYKNIQDIKDSMSDSSFESFHANLDETLQRLIVYCPDRMVVSGDGEKNNMFHINVPTFFGDNTVIVFNQGSGRWDFDKISFVKSLCGGVIAQTQFSITGASEKVDYLVNYESSFSASSNDNGLISFTFFPFRTTDVDLVSYVYNDTVFRLLPNEPGGGSSINFFITSYKKYKCTAYDTLIVGPENIHFYGNSGYALINIPDDSKLLSNAIDPWEIDGDITMTTVDTEGKEVTTTFEIAYQNVLGLEVNQIIIKPKNLSSFFKPCPASLVIPKLYIYEKRSFGEEPSIEEHEEIRLESASEDDSVTVVPSAELSSEDRHMYNLRKFDITTLLVSVVYKGITGRIRGVTRTKMITWVKQPFCRDVEIFYRWGASYTKEILIPEMWCYGHRDYRYQKEPVYHYKNPKCADHDIKSYSGLGSLWYPYNRCDPYERYNIITQFTEYDTSIIEQFSLTSDDGQPLHGAFDMRMMGPDDMYAYTDDVHLSIWDCHCDYTFANERKKNLDAGSSKNVFTGYGRYRGGLSAEDLAKCTVNEGVLPKFGNVCREFIRSYRSIDNINYYRLFTTEYFRDRKWVPVYTMYSKVDITSNIETSLYDMYTDDYSSNYMDQLGMLQALYLENININETIDENRYRFEDIFEPLHSLVSLSYPYPKSPYTVGLANPKAIIPWYRYKDHPSKSPNKSIQWSWQELWKEIERPNMITYLKDSNRMASDYVAPYNSSGDGRHIFLELDYPDYLYDAKLVEHRLVCDESEHTVQIIPCDFNEEGDVYFLLMLDSGPFRIFDVDGNLDPVVPESVKFSYDKYDSDKEKCKNLYTWCIGEDWVENVTLFDGNVELTETKEESNTKAKDDKRVIETYDEMGELVETFYNRGLNFTLLPANFSHLPAKKTVLAANLYELKLSKTPINNTTNYYDPESTIMYVPATIFVDLEYNCSLTTDYLEIKFNFKPGDSEDFRKRVITKVKCVFTVGAIKSDKPIGEWSGTLYHEPSVEIFASDNDLSYTSFYQDTSMTLSTKSSSSPTNKEWAHDFGFSKSLFKNPVNFIKLRFRLSPSEEEKFDAGVLNYYTLCHNKVYIKEIHLYESEFISGSETVNTHERLYRVSYGSHGDFPPQGTNDSGSLLYPINSDLSTPEQYDTINGVVGMPGSTGIITTTNKARGRIMEACHPDKESLPGRDLYVWEDEQRHIYDDIVNKAPSDFVMTSLCPPGLNEKLMSIGYKFPTWRCTFFNDYAMELASILPKAPYSPCGHEYHHNWQDKPKESTVCGPGNVRDDMIDYAYKNHCSESNSAESLDIFEFVAQTQLGAYFFNPLVFQQSDAIRMAKMDYSTKTTEDTTTFSLPDEMPPFI